MGKKIMILGASILQLPAIEKANEMGLKIVVVDMNPNAPGFSVKNVEKEIISTIDVSSIVKAAKRHQIDGIMTLATDKPMRAVAEVCEEMNLAGISRNTALKATNKAEMRAVLKEYNVPIPRFYKIRNKLEYKRVVQEFDRPFIVKPVDSSGSRGIFAVTDPTEQKLVDKAYEYCYVHAKGEGMIVEEYMKGPEVSVETLSINGVCHIVQITDKVTTGVPHYVEMGHSQPARHNKETLYEIAQITKMANEAIGIKNGPSHTEIIVTSDGPKIVEVGARLGGDNITTHLVPLSTGVDMVEACIKISLGENPDIIPKFSGCSAIRYFRQSAGTIKRIEGIEKAEKIKGVQQISIIHGIGEQITDIVDSGSRIGFVIAQGNSEKNAIDICDEALQSIKIEIEE